MIHTSPVRNPEQEDTGAESLRPSSLASFIGQKESKENLSIFLQAARARNTPMDHILFYGPPGLGKTTLAHIVAHEMGAQCRATSAPIITKPGDLAALLTHLQPGDVLFIDEIHRLPTVVEEMLYSAMEDYALDILVGEGPTARTLRIELPRFTLIGATTRLGLLSNPLRDRFGIPLRLNFYTVDELQEVLTRAASLHADSLSTEGAYEIARRARGTPRIALRLLRRVSDFALVLGASSITAEIADHALSKLYVDSLGLDSNDRRYLMLIAQHYHGGPVGIETIAAGLSEERDAIEDTIEPFLLQSGLIKRTPRGRMLTHTAYAHLHLSPPQHLEHSLHSSLFDEDMTQL